VSDNSIFLWDQSSMRVWDLPAGDAFSPISGYGDIVVIPNRPKASVQNFSDEGFIMSTTSPWHRSPSADCYLCQLYPGMPYLRLFSVKSPSESRDDFLPGSYLVPGGESDNEYGPGFRGWIGQGVSSLFQCEDELVLCSRSGGEQSALVAMVLKVPKSASLDEIVPFSRALTPCGSVTPSWSLYQFDFCAFSGRAVYFTPTGDVLVSDYVLPSYGT
jgi:hypothetical protein